MKKFNVLYLILFTSLIALNCGGEKEDPALVIRDNIKFANQKDLDSYMSTIHSENPGYENIHQYMGEVFFKYDIRYELVETEIISDEDDEVKVRFIQITSKKDGDNIKKNQVNGIYTLRKDAGFWKIYNTDVTDSKFIRE
ncbi:MAG: hypothetical protein IPM56_15205 [Ignavibacteriales bacterium]|nr:MAG: hypothetical protein IPM56_15205 [Ignavibacteriales bacterium]